jgi:hypothetical protein
MSKLLEEAFAKLAELPEEEQDFIASWLLEELHSESRWERVFAESHDALAGLADQALSEHRQGRAKELDPDNL